MPLLKRSAWGFAGLMVLVAGGVVALIFIVGGVGQSAVEAWVGSELKAVAGAHLKPELDFDTLDYQAPRTLVLTQVRLTADDPDHPGERVDIIDARRIRIELAELPREGEPLKLKSIELDGANVRLIDSDTGGLVGFSDFVVEKTSTDTPPISEVLQITKIVIKDSAIVYDARLPDAEPMRFDQINTTIDIDQSDGGQYALDLKLGREDVLDAKFIGLFDLDAMTLNVDELTADLDLSRDQDRYLPPQVQAFIKQYKLVGALKLKAGGELNLNDVAGSSADVVLNLTDAHGTVGGYRLPIDQLEIQAKMADRKVDMQRFSGKLLGGELSGEGAFALGGDLPAMLNLSGNGLRLEELVVAQDGEPVAVAGKVDLQVNADAPLADVLGQMRGAGEARIGDGRIARLPLVSNLIDFMARQGDLSRASAEGSDNGRDKARIVFELRGDHAYLSEADIEGTWFAMRGKGKLFFDGAMAMNINAGPLEKVQASLGTIGSVLSKVTDGLLAYRVTGAFGNMKIRPVPLGGLIGAPGENE